MPGRSCALAVALCLPLVFFAATGCEPEKPPRDPRAPKCPPPPEPDHQSVVVATIGRLHMVESGYPVTKLGDVIAAFKPDLVLVAVRVEPFREGALEDASFEMTYATALAKSRAIPVEPIDWFRPEDLGAEPPPVEPADEVDIAKREADALLRPKLLTFEQANAADLEEKVFLAELAEARHRSGNAPASRRAAWMEHLATDAVLRHGRPRRVLAFVDVFDRPGVDLSLRAVGYSAKDPVALVAGASEVMAGDVSADVLATYKAQLERVQQRAEKAEGPAKAFWQDRERVLRLVVERRAACCVTQSAIGP